MTKAARWRPESGQIPTSPGVYRFRDAEGRVIYVGKAKNLRQRLTSYFQDAAALHPRTAHMVANAASLEWTVVATEVEALALEYSWIKEFEPRFNIKYRDDKSYPYLAVTLTEEIPRALVTRAAKQAGNRYFGPFAQAWAIRETLDQLLRVFPVRTCSNAVLNRSRRSGRSCLLGYIEKCAAPCIGRISPEDHRDLAENLCAFMAGDTARFRRQVETAMRQAAMAQDFERAARLRDDAAALASVVERNAVVLPDGTDVDVFGLAQDDLQAAVEVFFVRAGRVRGQRGWVVDKVEDTTDAQLIEQLLLTVYSEPQADIPRQILVPAQPEAPQRITAWLESLRGNRIDLKVPQRGDKKALSQTVQINAEQALTRHKAHRSSDLTTRSQALRELQEALGLDQAPLRIECYDISTTQGTHQTASMVVFEDGLARKSQYRHFAVRGPDGNGAADDTAAIHEVITRRFQRLVTTGQASTGQDFDPTETETSVTNQINIIGQVDQTATKPRFAYRPNLVLVDGGPPQVAAAAKALTDLGVDNIALAGLAKRLEEVWLPDDAFPLILPRASEGLYLLQRLRDEAHRFAITHHRKKRTKAMTAGSALDAIDGVGPGRRQALLKHFGSLAKIKAASLTDLAAAPGVGQHLAATIYAALHP